MNHTRALKTESERARHTHTKESSAVMDFVPNKTLSLSLSHTHTHSLSLSLSLTALEELHTVNTEGDT